MVPLKLLNLVGSSALSPFFLLPLESRFLSFLVYGFMGKSNNCPRYLFICHHSIINFMHSTILPCIFDATNCCWNVIIIYEAVHPVLKKKNSGSACTSIAIEGKWFLRSMSSFRYSITIFSFSSYAPIMIPTSFLSLFGGVEN